MRQIFKTTEELKNVKNNNIVFDSKMDFVNSRISIDGNNNYIYLESGVKLYNSVINIIGDNSIVYVRKSNRRTMIEVTGRTNTVFYLGENCSFTKPAQFVLGEEKHIIIGSDCMFSNNNSLRNGDGHLIYDIETRKRINYGKSIYIGNHVWFGAGACVNKGGVVGSGTIIANKSLVTKNFSSNSLIGGAPAKLLKEGVMWDRTFVGSFTKESGSKYDIANPELEFVFDFSKDEKLFRELDKNLVSNNLVIQKVQFLDKL